MKAKLKRLLSCLLTAALLLQMAPFEALAADSSSTVSSPAVREDVMRARNPRRLLMRPTTMTTSHRRIPIFDGESDGGTGRV